MAHQQANKVVENTDAKPSGEMSDADLEKVAGGIIIVNGLPQLSVQPGVSDERIACRKAGGEQ